MIQISKKNNKVVAYEKYIFLNTYIYIFIFIRKILKINILVTDFEIDSSCLNCLTDEKEECKNLHLVKTIALIALKIERPNRSFYIQSTVTGNVTLTS